MNTRQSGQTGPEPDKPQFREVCRELLGENWRGNLPTLALILGVNRKTLEFIARGERPVSPAITERLAELLAFARRNRAEAAEAKAQYRAVHGER